MQFFKCCSAISMTSILANRVSGRATVHLILEEIITSNLTVTVAHGMQEYTSSTRLVSYETSLCYHVAISYKYLFVNYNNE